MFEKTINNRITIWILIGMIWLISLCGSILGYRLSKHGFILQPSELYCLNDFTLQGSIITFFNYGIVLTLIGTPILLTLIYFIIWKKLNHHEIYVPSNRISLRHSKIKIVNAKVLIVRRAMALSLGFAIVYYFQATIFVYQINTGKFIDWIYDAIGATLVSLNTIVYPITFLALDLRCRQAIFDFFGFIHGQSTNSNTSDAYTGQ
ncbi:hypothetical protein HDV02_004520 [Globomyces sp. JEL0801]|nr:hypothetical protein HDV02_004520 [Globomyces sp. JEL0801]